MRWLLLLLALAKPLTAQEARTWTATNRALASGAIVAVLSDWTTTIDIARRAEWQHWQPNHTPHQETGPGLLLIGRHPRLATVNRTFLLVSGFGAIALIRCVPQSRSPLAGLSWRNLALGTIVMLEGASGIGNRMTGLRFNTNF